MNVQGYFVLVAAVGVISACGGADRTATEKPINTAASVSGAATPDQAKSAPARPANQDPNRAAPVQRAGSEGRPIQERARSRGETPAEKERRHLREESTGEHNYDDSGSELQYEDNEADLANADGEHRS